MARKLKTPFVKEHTVAGDNTPNSIEPQGNELESKKIYDVIIIGAGAAGMVCGIEAAKRGKRVLLLEKNRKVGAKILMSGGTRCNVTHNTDNKGIIKAFGKNGKFLYSSLNNFSPENVVQMFSRLGVPTKIEATGKVFPESNKALHVQQALLQEVTDQGCHLQTQCPVVDIQKLEENLFEVQSENETFFGKKLVIATGGRSYPGCGTTGDGYRWVEKFGHQIGDTFPALVPVTCEMNWIEDLQGVAVQNSTISVLQANDFPGNIDWQQAKNLLKKKAITSSQTAILFTHFGLSGPAAMNVSKTISSNRSPNNLIGLIDVAPNVDKDAWENTWSTWKKNQGSSQVGRCVSKYCNNEIADRLWSKIFELANVDREKTIAEVSKKEFGSLVKKIHFLETKFTGTLGFEKAEVTAGGVNLKEVNPKTLESKKCPGLFLIGEILDLDGWIGGFNFQSAFSTGWTAGNSV